ncbi:MAG: PmoA family protein [Saprospiraceae bacterium]|nr:PmoA family protein [Saprospiraceae bacterium]
MVDDHLFTSYIYPDNIKKPVLYPLTTPMGTRITRRFPLNILWVKERTIRIM